MNDFEIWIYRGLIALLFMVIWYVVQKFASNVTNKLDELIKEIQKLSTTSVAHDSRMGGFEKEQNRQCAQLDDHEKRIRKIEQE